MTFHIQRLYPDPEPRGEIPPSQPRLTKKAKMWIAVVWLGSWALAGWWSSTAMDAAPQDNAAWYVANPPTPEMIAWVK